MARDIIVTTPKSEMKNAAKEAQDARLAGPDSCYFRALPTSPRGLLAGVSRIFYVEDGYVRGFGVIDTGNNGKYSHCDTTGRDWYGKCTVVTRASSWKWIKPIPMKGFQGWRYFDQPVEVVGDWLSPRPKE
jgi:hypothetical protein